ncbi:MAG: efflux RND transporter periplasmic adaptor subunit [Orrella sp.]
MAPRWLSRFSFAGVLVLTGLLAACGDEAQQGQRPAPLVSVVEVQPTRAVMTADLPGRVDAMRDAQVRARVTGIVEQITFEQGRDVVAGQLLFEIDPAPYQATVNQAKAELQRAQADARAAESLAKRYAPLVKINAVSRQEYDDAVARSEQAAANVLAAQAALETAEINLAYTRVTSPIDGRIGEAMVTEGALVEASSATQMALVQQITPVYVDVYQSTTELAKLREALRDGRLQKIDEQTARATIVLEDGSLYSEPGRLLFTGFTVNPSTGQVVLRTMVDNPDEVLLPGMYVRVRIEQAVDEGALLVPPQALQRSANGLTNVYVVREDAATLVPVQTGNDYEGQTLILSGLSAGDKVIVEGIQKIRPGAPVQTKPWQPDDEAASSSSRADR